jgi:hypothetical protein
MTYTCIRYTNDERDEMIGSRNPDSKHAIHVRRRWWDKEPEYLEVSVESSSETGERFTVFTTSSTWLNSEQLAQLIDYLEYCQTVMEEEDTP